MDPSIEFCSSKYLEIGPSSNQFICEISPFIMSAPPVELDVSAALNAIKSPAIVDLV